MFGLAFARPKFPGFHFDVDFHRRNNSDIICEKANAGWIEFMPISSKTQLTSIHEAQMRHEYWIRRYMIYLFI